MKDDPKAGSLPGAILLISGCCIGAGMLGLPMMSALAGFQPSLIMFFISWLFMTATALLLLEVNLNFDSEVSLITMAKTTLGLGGEIASWLCYIFLFYTLGIAYISGSGELISSFIEWIPPYIGGLLLCFVFAVFVYLGTQAVDIFNRFLMIGLAISYLLLVSLGIPHVKGEYLLYKNWSAAPLVLPILVISFGFHNIIPTLTSYFKRDVKRLRLAVIGGSALPLIIYIIWEVVILGLVPSEGKGGLKETLGEGEMVTNALKAVGGVNWVVGVTQLFALLAILTSFLGNSLSFVDFLADGLNIHKDRKGTLLLCILVIFPPFILSIAYPKIFLSALNFAGAFGAVILFGILPALMAWSARYHKGWKGLKLLPGGKISLGIVILFALCVILLEATRMI